MNQKLIREIGRTQRLDILTALKRYGSMTVKEMAAGFRMSYMGIKQHCLELEKGGYLDTWRRPGKVGRPEMLYRLTDKARGLFPGGNNALALGVLEAVQGTYGPAAPTKILFGIFARQTERYRKQVQGTSLEERARRLAQLRDDDGHMAEFERDEPEPGADPTGNGAPRIVEYHSPIEDLLRRFPILARLEKELFERVLGCPVRREESSEQGFYRCTFYLG